MRRVQRRRLSFLTRGRIFAEKQQKKKSIRSLIQSNKYHSNEQNVEMVERINQHSSGLSAGQPLQELQDQFFCMKRDQD